MRDVGDIPRDHQRLEVLLGRPDDQGLEDAQALCVRRGWAYRFLNNLYAEVFLARTPCGLAMSIVKNQPSPAGYILGRHVVIYNAAENSGEPYYWRDERTDDAARAFWESLPMGCTPLILATGSRHRVMDGMLRWRAHQQDLRGWTGRVQEIPEHVLIDRNSSEGFGSSLLALRQGRFMVFLVVALDQVDAWFDGGQDVPLPDCEMTGVFYMDDGNPVG